MNPMKGLLIKDYRISRQSFLIWAGVLVLALAGGIGLSVYTSQPAGTLPVLVLTGFAHFAFAPVLMLTLLNLEAKTQLWLHTPRRGIELILSKYGVIFCYQLVLQVLLSIFAAYSLFLFGREVYEPIGFRLFLEAAVVLNALLLVVGLYLATWLTFLWTVFHSLKNLVKTVRWFIVIGIVIVYNTIESYLLTLAPIRNFITKFNFNVISEAALSYKDEQWSVILDSTAIPVIPLFYYALLIIILITAAAKLLERKVEV
ncbi:MAG: hypothetical protein ACQEXB_21655 [Bacillota bacterium]